VAAAVAVIRITGLCWSQRVLVSGIHVTLLHCDCNVLLACLGTATNYLLHDVLGVATGSLLIIISLKNVLLGSTCSYCLMFG